MKQNETNWAERVKEAIASGYYPGVEQAGGDGISKLTGRGHQRVIAGDASDGYLYGFVGIRLKETGVNADGEPTATFYVDLMDNDNLVPLVISTQEIILEQGQTGLITDTLMALEVVPYED